MLRVEGLSHVYNPGTAFARNALTDINLDIAVGECLGIIGHTGSGKSTLVQHFNALLKPTSGRVLLDGADLFADKKQFKALRQQVGLVFQYPEHQLFEMTVRQDVAYGPRNMGLPKDEVDRRVHAALDAVGLPPDLHEASPFALSGGQKRRAAIAGVLAMQPRVLILDEPTAGLDPAGRNAILAQIESLHKNLGITVIMVSHSMDEVARMANRIVVMSQGRILLCGTPAEVFAQEETIQAAGLDVPPLVRLAKRLRQNGHPLPPGIFSVEGMAAALR